MHDERTAYCRKHSEGCVWRARLKDSHADEWARIASHWEMLARIRERMPMIARRQESEREQIPNAQRG